MQALPVLLFHSVDDAEVPFQLASHGEAKHQFLQGSRDIADRFKNNSGCYELHYIYRARHAYGFSSDYLSKSITNFIALVRQGKCRSTEVENKGDINLNFVDLDSDAIINVEKKTITLSPKALQPYAGKYERNGEVISVSVEGDHLKVEAPGGQLHELYPVKEDTFIEKKLNIQTTFTKDAKGNVIDHKVLHSQNTQLRYKKIK
jgi:hypothetical protein